MTVILGFFLVLVKVNGRTAEALLMGSGPTLNSWT